MKNGIVFICSCPVGAYMGSEDMGTDIEKDPEDSVESKPIDNGRG